MLGVSSQRNVCTCAENRVFTDRGPAPSAFPDAEHKANAEFLVWKSAEQTSPFPPRHSPAGSEGFVGKVPRFTPRRRRAASAMSRRERSLAPRHRRRRAVCRRDGGKRRASASHSPASSSARRETGPFRNTTPPSSTACTGRSGSLRLLQTAHDAAEGEGEGMGLSTLSRPRALGQINPRGDGQIRRRGVNRGLRLPRLRMHYWPITSGRKCTGVGGGGG